MQVSNISLSTSGNQIQGSTPQTAATPPKEQPSSAPTFAISEEEYAQDIKMDMAMLDRVQMMQESDSPTQKMYQKIEKTMNDISEERPDLMAKSWDFGINESGELDLKYTDDLSDSDKQYLQDKLDSSGIAIHAETYADDLVFIVESDRGVHGVSNSIGKFDVSRENFSELIDLRSAFESVNSSDLVTKSGSKARHNSVEVFAEQLSEKADPKYQIVYNKPK